MNRTASAASLLLACGLALAADRPNSSASASTACPVTLPPSDGARYGNGALQTGLWPEGKVIFKPGGPGGELADGALFMKFWWWRLHPGRLTFDGRRLDAPAPPLRADVPDGYGLTGFQSTALIFPAPGCWEVTGRLGEDSLTFVTLVVKIGQGPAGWNSQ
jgi:hypothetical protein